MMQDEDIKNNNEGESAEPMFAEDKAESLDAEQNKLIEEAALYKDKYVRTLAEFENVRKRYDREKIEFIKYANEGLIVEFLGILDDLERSVEAAKAKPEDYAAFLKGIEMVMSQVREMLKRNGVKVMDVKGKIFDPHSHEILMQEERDDVEDGTITEEFQKGYLLGDKVIRTAKVKVAKKK